MNITQSHQLYLRSEQSIAGGVSSSARTVHAGHAPHPLFMQDGRGAEIRDVDGNRYIDYLLSHGALILGHCDPDVQEAVLSQVSRGSMFGAGFEPECRLAELLVEIIPCAELVRFANTGSDAVAAAVRLARTYTGKHKVLKFEGHYHGSMDDLYTSCRPPLESAGPPERPNGVPHAEGIPPDVTNQAIIAPWNDAEAVASILHDHGDEIAAVIAEPLVANCGCLMPAPGFLDFLRNETNRRGIVLIFDEVATGFRVALGGAQEYFGVVPDLVVLSKALGGGYPVAAFAGKRAFMELIARGQAKHSGTYNANPIGIVAAYATMRKLRDNKDAIYARMSEVAASLKAGMVDLATRAGFPLTTLGVGSLLQIFFTEQDDFRNYRDLQGVDVGRFARLRQSLLERGVFVNPSNHAAWFVSAAHTLEHVDQTLSAFDSAMKHIGRQSVRRSTTHQA
jgi:glutamate-1-semialdehyde 2,1-aminomutase